MEGGRCIVACMTRQRTTPTHSPHPTRSALQRLTIFEECARADLDTLSADIDLITVPAGTVLDRQGTSARQFIGIVDGYVRGVGTDGEPFVLGPGDHIGAAEIFSDQPYAATYTTSTSTTIAAAFGPRFRAVARSLPGVMDRARSVRRSARADAAFATVG